MNSELPTRIIDVTLEDGTLIKVEASVSGREDVALNTRPITEFFHSLEKIVEALYATLSKCKPDKTVVTFGVELGLESGQLTTLIVKGSTKANFSVTLEWSNPSAK